MDTQALCETPNYCFFSPVPTLEMGYKKAITIFYVYKLDIQSVSVSVT